MSRKHHIQFDLLSNARDSLRPAVELLAWRDLGSDHARLRELARIEGDAVRAQGRIPRYDAHMRWEQCSWDTRVVPELESVFSKLESYGLVSRIPPPNNLNIMADDQNRHVLLQKGTRFVDLIQSLART